MLELLYAWKKKVSAWAFFLFVVVLFLVIVYGVLGRADIAKQRYKNINGKITLTEQLVVEKEALDAVIKILQTLGALGFFFTAYVSWKSLQHAEDKQVTERFSKAVELLSEAGKFEARIGGIYLLERIARDSPEDHSTVMEVLTTYVREQCPISKPCSGENEDDKELQKVRTDVQAALTVIGRRESANDKNTRLNLNGADLSNTYLYKADLKRANLIQAHLKRAQLNGAKLNNADLTLANLSGAMLQKANLSNTNLCATTLCFANLSYADLRRADLNYADLRGAILTGIKNFSSDQIKSAKNWESAFYDNKRLNDPEISKRLGLDAKP